MKANFITIAWVLAGMFFCGSCNEKTASNTQPFFTMLTQAQTGLNFNNTVLPTEDFNMFTYMYFYNGAGVGAGDFNKDGSIDLFFAANQTSNKLYLNQGGLHFKDASGQAGIPQDKAWSTGVSVIDINNDGMLDIYVCRVGNFKNLHSKNQLLLCKQIKDGIPIYEDEAARYGLDFSGFSTQAAFLDYDLDGDLDMYLLNHSVHQSSSFAPRKNFDNTYSLLSGDRLYRNDGTVFTDVTSLSKINSTEIGYGLGVAVSDINMDGWPDLYIGNDFHENDYLYINQQNGQFADENATRLMHTSKFSMGVDIADVNNDAYPEIVSMDMLANDPYILKRSLGDDDYDVFYSKIASGYNYQYSRNMLQLNRRNGHFSDVGLYAGIAATDWSWAPLWMDFNNDGNKDLFVSNGIPKRLNDMDYINFIYNSEFQQKLQNNNMKGNDIELINKFPEIKIPNKFFINTGDLKFNDGAALVENNQPTFSNGAVYADFDNDGDLDVVVNNINDPVFLYENKTNQNNQAKSVRVILKGDSANINAIGAKLILFAGNDVQCYQKNPVKGFLSSMEEAVHIGLGNKKIDSAFVVWPNNTVQPIRVDTAAQIQVTYTQGLPVFNYSVLYNFKPNTTLPVTNITSATGINYAHHENVFNEFNREPLLPHMLSTEGPALAVADINNDGLEDVFIGQAKLQHNALFIQQANGQFKKIQPAALYADSMYEDADAVFADVNNDGFKDLLLVSAGNEYFGNDVHLMPRVYLNDGKAGFTKLTDAFAGLYYTFSCIAVNDFNGDGFADLFLGGRAVPWSYGEVPHSYLLQNDGTGHFKDVTQPIAPGLSTAGMVTGAAWCDINNDHHNDLVVCYDWGGIKAWQYSNQTYTQQNIVTQNGWWNFVKPLDADNDGDIDLVAGNLGLNTRLQASASEPVKMYFNDFDGNGKKEQVITFFVEGREVTLSSKSELELQMPVIKKDYIYAQDFAKAKINELLGQKNVQNGVVYQADYFANAIMLNDGTGKFTVTPMPWQAQLTSYRDALSFNANNDSLPDLFLCGNYYANNIHKGRYDADFGTILVNKGAGRFEAEVVNGVFVKGEARKISGIQINKKPAAIIARNNDTAMVIGFSSPYITGK